MSTSADIRLDRMAAGMAGRCWGNVPDPHRVVVLVHGYGEHGGRYEHVGRRLARDGAVVYALDHRGHGLSEGEPGLVPDFDALVRDVACVLAAARARHGGLPVAMIGHSMGGVVATRLVQRDDHRIAALVLAAPLIGGSPEIERLLEVDPLPDIAIDGTMRSRDPSVGVAHATDPLVYHGPFRRATLEAIFAGVRAIAGGPTLGSTPTLWVHGEDDPLAPLARTRAAVDRVRGDRFEKLILPGARHEVLNETNREQVVDVVARFLLVNAPAPSSEHE
jgi:alpha-beta hydrolase superfamily lysophospholipase